MGAMGAPMGGLSAMGKGMCGEWGRDEHLGVWAQLDCYMGICLVQESAVRVRFVSCSLRTVTVSNPTLFRACVILV